MPVYLCFKSRFPFGNVRAAINGPAVRLSRVLFVLLSLFLINGSIFRADAQTSGKKVVLDRAGKNVILAPPPTVNVTAPTALQFTPATFVVPITVDDVTSAGIFAFQFNIVYDPTVIEPSGANFGCSTAGTIAGTAGLSPTCNVLPDGTLRVSVSGANPMTGSGTILKVTFATTPTAVVGNVSPLTFQSVFFFNSSGPVTNLPHD